MNGVVLHVSPHPDDELLGAPAALMALRDAGHEVVNLVVSLGRAPDRRRRRKEAKKASSRAGFNIVLANPPVDISRDNLVDAEGKVRRLVEEHLDKRGASVVVSPSPHDRHHGHEVVARGVREALRERSDPPVWWMWGLWGPLSFPSLFVPFDEDRRKEIVAALWEHAGEIARHDYRRLVGARGEANVVLGPELIHEFGDPGRKSEYADLLSEVLRHQGGWWLGRPRDLDPANAFDTEPHEKADAWVDAPSLSQLSA